MSATTSTSRGSRLLLATAAVTVTVCGYVSASSLVAIGLDNVLDAYTQQTYLQLDSKTKATTSSFKLDLDSNVRLLPNTGMYSPVSNMWHLEAINMDTIHSSVVTLDARDGSTVSQTPAPEFIAFSNIIGDSKKGTVYMGWFNETSRVPSIAEFIPSPSPKSAGSYRELTVLNGIQALNIDTAAYDETRERAFFVTRMDSNRATGQGLLSWSPTTNAIVDQEQGLDWTIQSLVYHQSEHVLYAWASDFDHDGCLVKIDTHKTFANVTDIVLCSGGAGDLVLITVNSIINEDTNIMTVYTEDDSALPKKGNTWFDYDLEKRTRISHGKVDKFINNFALL